MSNWQWSDIGRGFKQKPVHAPRGPMTRVIVQLSKCDLRELHLASQHCNVTVQTLKRWQAGQVRSGYADKVECVELFLKGRNK